MFAGGFETNRRVLCGVFIVCNVFITKQGVEPCFCVSSQLSVGGKRSACTPLRAFEACVCVFIQHLSHS